MVLACVLRLLERRKVVIGFASRVSSSTVSHISMLSSVLGSGAAINPSDVSEDIFVGVDQARPRFQSLSYGSLQLPIKEE